jgi:phage terminase large subunit
MIYIIVLLLSVICIQIYKIKKINIEPQIKQPDYHIILHHTRATDRVFFGPFKNITEVQDWYKTNPHASQVKNSIEVLVSPYSNPDDWWYIPLDHPDMLNADQLALFD